MANEEKTEEEEEKKLKLWIGSWNLGSVEPDADGLAGWLATAAGCDLVAIGVQEASYSPSPGRTRLSMSGASALACASVAALAHPPILPLVWALGSGAAGFFATNTVASELSCRTHFASSCLHYLCSHDGSRYNYRQIACASLLHIRLLLFARDTIPADCVSNIEICSLSCGALGGSLANKGGVLCRLRLFDCTYAFVAAHLAPHTGGLSQRNVQTRQLLEQLHVNARNFSLDISTDMVFLFGDLNYRFSTLSSPSVPLPYVSGTSRDNKQEFDSALRNVLHAIEHGQIVPLLHADQLQHELREGWALDGFEESPIRFDPTFKRERGKKRRKYMHTRLPAWTDRILHKTRHGCKDKLQQISYNSYSDLTSSDHDAVYGIFDLYVSCPPKKPSGSAAVRKKVTTTLSELKFVLERSRFQSLSCAFNENVDNADAMVVCHSFDSEGHLEDDVWRSSPVARAQQEEGSNQIVWSWEHSAITHDVSIPNMSEVRMQPYISSICSHSSHCPYMRGCFCRVCTVMCIWRCPSTSPLVQFAHKQQLRYEMRS